MCIICIFHHRESDSARCVRTGKKNNTSFVHFVYLPIVLFYAHRTVLAVISPEGFDTIIVNDIIINFFLNSGWFIEDISLFLHKYFARNWQHDLTRSKLEYEWHLFYIQLTEKKFIGKNFFGSGICIFSWLGFRWIKYTVMI